MKTIIWAWGPSGGGHATRAVAMARWLDDPFVIRGGTDKNELLDKYEIPYKVFDNRTTASKFIQNSEYKNLIFDADIKYYHIPERVNTKVFYVWRYGRKQISYISTIYVEDKTNAFWPLVHLDSEEILTKGEAREYLDIPRNSYLKIGIPSLVDANLVKEDFMLTEAPLRYMAAADELVAAIGYNTFAEVSYHGIPCEWRVVKNRIDQKIRYENLNKPKFFVKDAGKKVAQYIEVS